MRSELPSPPSFPPFPKFPSLAELAEPELAPRRPQGLFEGLLGGHVLVLFQDTLDYPDKYDPTTQQLVQELGTGQRKQEDLSPQERRTLDFAVLDFMETPKRTPAPPPKRKAEPVGDEEFDEEGEEKQAEAVEGTPPVPGLDIPEDAVAPFWWT